MYIGRDLTELSEARDADETGNDDKFESYRHPRVLSSHFSSQKERFSRKKDLPVHKAGW